MTQRPLIIGVGGLSSEVGKTTLMCELLQAFPGWEAIKTTRGHYRSCGKDPQACCVSHLLGDEPVIHSGRESTYSPGKDSGRYWDAGATNVHWLIATNQQLREGIRRTLERVQAPGVFIEGNSFTEFVQPHFFIMVARGNQLKIKPTANRALRHVSVVYLSDAAGVAARGADQENVAKLLARVPSSIPVCEELPQLVGMVQELIPTIVSQNAEEDPSADRSTPLVAGKKPALIEPCRHYDSAT
jgi:molybdopterin-guanine dinucleotide biosynthesis protein